MRIILHTPEHDFEIEVREMTTLDHLHSRRYREALTKREIEDVDASILLTYFYAPMKHASSGDVPNEDQFLKLPGSVSNEWYMAVDACNPGLLPKDDKETSAGTSEEDVEKKELTQTESSSG